MRLILPLVLIGLPLAEIAVFIKVGAWLGLGPTLAAILLAALAGIWLIRHQSLATLAKVRAALERREAPTAELFDGACLLVAGLLLILPGFISDLAALLLLIAPLRQALRRSLALRTRIWVDGRPVGPGPDRPGPTIAGEYHEIDEAAPPLPPSRWGRDPP